MGNSTASRVSRVNNFRMMGRTVQHSKVTRYRENIKITSMSALAKSDKQQSHDRQNSDQKRQNFHQTHRRDMEKIT
jgi:hypothetical protein